MKNPAIKQSNLIFSRIKESFEGVLSIFNGITELDSEIELPNELLNSLNHLDEKAKNFEVNGITSSKSSEHTQVRTSKINSTKATKIITKPVAKTEFLNKNSKNIEKGEDR